MAYRNSRIAVTPVARKRKSDGGSATIADLLNAKLARTGHQLAFTYRSPLTGNPLVSGEIVKTNRGEMVVPMPNAEAYMVEVGKLIKEIKARSRRDLVMQSIWCISTDESKLFGGYIR